MKDLLYNKIKNLATDEEKYNITREFLQELILQIIDRKGYVANLAFIGGTALRVLYDLPRFSEDLDFSLVKKEGFDFAALLNAVKKELGLNNFEVELGKEKTQERAVLGEFLRFKSLLFDLEISKHKNEKLFIKLEVDSNPPGGYQTEIYMVNKNFLFKVNGFDLPSLFAGKLSAFLFRKYAKGRDYYDLLWFLARKTPINYKLLSAGAEQATGEKIALNKASLRKLLENKIGQANFVRIAHDASRFMQNQKELEYFKKEYFLSAVEKGML